MARVNTDIFEISELKTEGKGLCKEKERRLRSVDSEQ